MMRRLNVQHHIFESQHKKHGVVNNDSMAGTLKDNLLRFKR